MEFWECIKVAGEGVWTNKLRSILTMLGIVIGIAAVIAVVAIGQGGQVLITTEFEKLGSPSLFFVSIDQQDGEPTTVRDFSEEDMDIIKSLVPTVQGVVPSFQGMSIATIESSRKSELASIQPANGDYQFMSNVQMLKGRFFSNADTKAGRKVIVLEEKLAKDIFGRAEAIGKTVSIHNILIKVIGTAKSKDSILLGGANIGYMPYTVWQDIFNVNVIQGFQVQTHSPDQTKEGVDKVIKILERKHNNKGRYISMTMEQQMEGLNRITGIMTLIVGAIAGISLFVGGIGVMNIMLVSVTERTREIGIRKALGASRKDILLQFLIESLTICSIGGFLGMSLGIGSAYLVAKFAKWPPLVSWSTVLIAFLFSSLVGVFFGIYPASKAAKLETVDALRYE